MKKLEFYEEYIQYLNWRLEIGEISKGKLALLKISKSEYDKFIDKLETNEKFNKKIISIITREKRDKIQEFIQSLLRKDYTETEVQLGVSKEEIGDKYSIKIDGTKVTVKLRNRK